MKLIERSDWLNIYAPYEGNQGDFMAMQRGARYSFSDIQVGSGQLDCPN